MSGPETMSTGASKQNGFRLDRANGKLMGVCAGLGNSLGVDPVIVRIGFVLGTLCGAGVLVPIYLAIGLIAG